MKHLLAPLALVLAMSSASAQIITETIPFDPVQTATGAVSGKVLDNGVRAWLGVPFAAPPLRDLRWQPPQPPEPWEGVWQADRFAPQCMQRLRNSNINHYFGEEAISEDCLYLNVWAPEDVTPDSSLPVVVWIYGGGFSVGSASMDNYQGVNLARQGVIYVSIAYRLGAMGFMAHPELAAGTDYGGSGNFGFMDQAFALEWIRDNIAGFGGDPGNVTITGQSAGSMSLSALQTSPLAKGLFHKIFGMSGSLMQPFGTDYATMEARGLEAQRQLGAVDIAEMRAISADRFLGLEGPGFSATWDGYVLPVPPSEAFANGAFHDVPLVAGYTRDESFHPIGRAVTEEAFLEGLQQHWPDRAEALAAHYDVAARGVRRAAVDLSRDAAMGGATLRWARAQVEHGEAPVWVYRFDRVQPYTPGITFPDHDPQTVGAYHSVEIPYFLDTLESLNMFRTTRDWSPDDETLRDVASGALVSLARNGSPAHEDLDWPQYDMDSQQVVIFDIGEIRAQELPDRAGFDILQSSASD